VQATQVERALGSVFADYRIEARLGRGGMGVVYRASELGGARRPVALKLILPDRAADREFRDRFEREARTARSVSHPNVIPVYAAGEHEGVAYMAMALVDGIDLEALLGGRGAPLHPRHAAAVIAPIAFALGAAHELGLVHRDVKPANILVEPRASADGPAADPHVWLMDFGLTKHQASTSGLTRAGQWVGTIDYAAPEQIHGEPVDQRTDVYALGCVLHECLSGTIPFPADRDVSKIMAHVSEPPPVTFGVVPGVPQEFDAIVYRAMEKNPVDRFGSAAEMGDAVLAAAERCTTEPSEPLAAGAGRAADPAGVDRDAPTVI
jgi:serine/threonine protein kinase